MVCGKGKKYEAGVLLVARPFQQGANQYSISNNILGSEVTAIKLEFVDIRQVVVRKALKRIGGEGKFLQEWVTMPAKFMEIITLKSEHLDFLAFRFQSCSIRYHPSIILSDSAGCLE